jgi:hypothetical protein
VIEPHPVLDVVVFSLKPGATRERFLGTVDAVSRWAQDQRGFVSRELSYAEADDRWIELVKWDTAEDADRAAEAEQSAEACQPMFGLIDWDSILIMRAEAAIPAVTAHVGQSIRA